MAIVSDAIHYYTRWWYKMIVPTGEFEVEDRQPQSDPSPPKVSPSVENLLQAGLQWITANWFQQQSIN